jgi:hypothetical protein
MRDFGEVLSCSQEMKSILMHMAVLYEGERGARNGRRFQRRNMMISEEIGGCLLSKSSSIFNTIPDIFMVKYHRG